MLSWLRDKLLRDQRHTTMVKTFTTAIGLLGIALMAALYSSSMGRDGRVLAAGISALIALSIALWVGFRFVPRIKVELGGNHLSDFHSSPQRKESFSELLAELRTARRKCLSILQLLYTCGAGAAARHPGRAGDAQQARSVLGEPDQVGVTLSLRVFRERQKVSGRSGVHLLPGNPSAGADQFFGSGHPG